MTKLRSAALAILVAATIGSASAETFFEREPWDLASNDSFGTAQYLGVLQDSRPIVVVGSRELAQFGGSSADFFAFDVPAARTITMTIDTPRGPAYGNDPVLGLFDVFGSSLSVDDDSGPGFDSEITRTLSPGTYYAAVSGFSDFSFIGFGSADYPYALTLAAAVPEPGTYAMVLAGLGALALWRRRRT